VAGERQWGTRKLPRGWGRQWKARGGGSAANRRAPELEEMAAVVLGVLGK
jgi:hypothetical protein